MSPFKVLTTIAFLALAACSAPQSGLINQGPQDAIIGGADVAADSPLAASIVGIFDLSEGGLCTGSLLSNNVVLTAAHCIGADPTKMVIVFGTDVFKIIQSGDRDLIRKTIRPVSSAKTHSAWKNGGRTTKWGWNDIALIKFKGNVPEGFKPIRLLTDAKELEIGTAVTMAGYGVSKIEFKEADPTSFDDLETSIAEGDVFCSANRKKCATMESSGDGTLRSIDQAVAFVVENEVVISQEDGRGTCSGDSGGPAYVMKDGEYHLWGITSRGDATCSIAGIYTFATNYISWINTEAALLK